jgi:hypothetical protein
MKISLIVEGKTEKAFIPFLRTYLQGQLAGMMPRLDLVPYDGRIPTGDKLRRIVNSLLTNITNPADHVIALTDVYTGSNPPDFVDGLDAKNKMRQWVGSESRFHPHVAQYDFEAWLLSYWPTIQKMAGHNRNAPPGNPESVNHGNPPSYRIREIFRTGTCRDDYVKPRDAARILRENELSVAVARCSELKALVNTIISVCGGTIIS